MKAVIAILLLIAAACAIAAISGIQHISFSGGTTVMTYHPVSSRVAAALVGVAALFAAYGCFKRKKYGWYMVAIMLLVMFLGAIWNVIYGLVTYDLPLAGLLLGSIGEGVKVGLIGWVLFGFWRKKRKEFQTPNPPLRMPASGTPAASAP